MSDANRVPTHIRLVCGLQEMKSDGHDPTSWTYNALINAYGQGGQPEDAVRVYRDMERSGAPHSTPNPTPNPTHNLVGHPSSNAQRVAA